MLITLPSPRTAVLAVGLVLAACSTAPSGESPTSVTPSTTIQGAEDPLEPVNRVVFDANDFMDRLLLKPIAELYRVTVPPGLRDRLVAILSNMGEPVIFANNLLQGRANEASTTFARFIINTTVGLGGLYDVASEWQLPEQQGDFGQTLHVWGVGSGPYLVLPLFGPSTARDAVGLAADSLTLPWPYVADAAGGAYARDTFSLGSMGATAVVQREAAIDPLESLQAGSLDMYAQMRSMYLQYRNKTLGIAPPSPAFEDEQVSTR